MKKLIIFVLCVLAFLLSSCENGEKTGGEAENGRTAVLFSSLAEIWTEAGGRVDITVGETVKRGFADEDAVLCDTGAGKQINAELLFSADPALIIYSSDIPAQVEVARLAEKNGISTLGLRVESFSDYLSALRKMTELTGRGDIYEKTAEAMGQAIEKLISDSAEAGFFGKKVLFIRAGSTVASTKTKKTEEHFAAAMLSELGCVNIADEAPFSELGAEAVLDADPDYIFISLMGNEEAARKNVEELLSSPLWSALSAVKENQTFILPSELFHYKPCSRWDEAYEYLFDVLKGE